MKKKALIIGALPRPFVGYWVDISDAREWSVRTEHEDDPCVVIELLPSGRIEASGGVVVSGQMARVVIEKGVRIGKRISVILVETNGKG
jgi:hypothetical protein